MERWLGIARGVERLNLALGRGVAWLGVVMIALGAWNASVRYLGRFTGTSLASNAYIELQWYLFSALFLLGASATLASGGHVRVDVLYGRLGERARAWIDLVGTLVFLIPFCTFAIVVSWSAVANSWAILEGSPDPGGLPRYPIKTLIPIGFGLLIVQGLAQALQQLAVLLGRDARDPA